MIARVVPDVPAIEKEFDYLVPEHLRDQVRVGTLVRVNLQGRRVGGWVVGLGVGPLPGIELKPIAKVTGWGPPSAVVELARWAAHRWAGRPVHLLRTASPRGVVRGLPASPTGVAADSSAEHETFGEPGTVVVRLPPAADRWRIVEAATARGPALVVCPSVAMAERLAARLQREGRPVVALLDDATPTAHATAWARAAAGGVTVVGARSAVWAPVPDAQLSAIVVLDEHDEALQGEQTPTWHARDVAVERARRAGVPCVLVSPVPTLDALAIADRIIAPGASSERAGWPVVDIIDRRDEDPVKAGLWSPRLVAIARDQNRGRVVCVLNRLGRSRLLACMACGAVTCCDQCGAAVVQPEPGLLRCRSCGTERPGVCQACGGARLKNLRMGVARAREELEALVGEPVLEVTAETDVAAIGDARVLAGTEAVLHRVGAGSVGTVAFLDFDQELLAPRYRAGEQALTLLVRAARAAGGRADGGRVLVQTRQPDHAALQAAVLGDPERFTDAERARREVLRYPPTAALALVSGAGADEWAAAAPEVDGVEVLGPADAGYLVRAPDHESLSDYLASVPRPAVRTRIAVDPPRI